MIFLSDVRIVAKNLQLEERYNLEDWSEITQTKAATRKVRRWDKWKRYDPGAVEGARLIVWGACKNDAQSEAVLLLGRQSGFSQENKNKYMEYFKSREIKADNWLLRFLGYKKKKKIHWGNSVINNCRK